MFDNNYYKLSEVLFGNKNIPVRRAIIGKDMKKPIHGFFVDARISAYIPLEYYDKIYMYEITVDPDTGMMDCIWANSAPESKLDCIIGTFVSTTLIKMTREYSINESSGIFTYKKFSGKFKLELPEYDVNDKILELELGEFSKKTGCWYLSYKDIVDHVGVPIILGKDTSKPVYGLKYKEIEGLGNEYVAGMYNTEKLPKGVSPYIVVNKKSDNTLNIIEPKFSFLYMSNDKFKFKYVILLPDDQFTLRNKTGIKKIASDFITIARSNADKKKIREIFEQYGNYNT